MLEEGYFDPSKITIRKIDKYLAKEMIVKNHYSHKWSLCNIAYGIFYITDKRCEFFDGFEEKLIGTLVYGGPVGRSAALSISPSVKIDEVIELTRLFIHDGQNYGKNIESFCISQSLKLLKKDFPEIKVVISYSDEEMGHRGVIYQSANFLFLGRNSDTNLMPNFSVSLTGPPDYRWMHSRSVFSKYGSHNIPHLKKKIAKNFWRKKEAGKLKYIYIISNKKIKREILKTLKMKILPYPKKCNYEENIEKIEVVYNLQENQFFG